MCVYANKIKEKKNYIYIYMKRKEKQMYVCMYVCISLPIAYLSACNPNSNEETPLMLRVFFFTQGSALEPHV